MGTIKIGLAVVIAVAGLLVAAFALPETGHTERLAADSQAEAVPASEPAVAEPADDGGAASEDEHAVGADEAAADHGDAEEDHDSGFWFGEPADPAEADRVIEITAGEFFFSPDPIQVRVGEVVTFRVTNVGKVAHDFTIGDKKVQLKHEEEMAEMLAAGAMGDEEVGEEHAEPNTGAMDPGETVEVTWRFTAPGLLEIGCHVPGHYSAGMLVPLEVRA